jgi:mannose-6-phosphate isomerase-like protein (cupin superfamily)
MKLIKTRTHRGDFAVLHATGTSQAAMMTLAPGESTSESTGNEHAWAEQWMYIVQGEGRAKTKGKQVALGPGSLLLIEKGEPHQITNTGEVPLVTLNVYAPPAYDKQGEPLWQLA